MVLSPPQVDVLALDEAGKPVAAVQVSAVENAGVADCRQLNEYLKRADETVPYAIFADLTLIRVFRVHGRQAVEELARLSTRQIAARYDPNFAAKRIFHEYLAEILSAWLRDVAYHWKSEHPPAEDTLQSIGLAQMLAGGDTRREFAQAV